jgi:hypothetical protein
MILSADVIGNGICFRKGSTDMNKNRHKLFHSHREFGDDSELSYSGNKRMISVLSCFTHLLVSLS